MGFSTGAFVAESSTLGIFAGVALVATDSGSGAAADFGAVVLSAASAFGFDFSAAAAKCPLSMCSFMSFHSSPSLALLIQALSLSHAASWSFGITKACFLMMCFLFGGRGKHPGAVDIAFTVDADCDPGFNCVEVSPTL